MKENTVHDVLIRSPTRQIHESWKFKHRDAI